MVDAHKPPAQLAGHPEPGIEPRNAWDDDGSPAPHSAGATKIPDQPPPSQGYAGHEAGLPAQMARSAQGLAKAQLEKQAGRGSEELQNVAKALRQTSQGLNSSAASPYVAKAADQVERASQYLRNASAKDVMEGARAFAQREPLLFLGGAFALGLLGSRFMKSSAQDHPGHAAPVRSASSGSSLP